MNVLIDIASIVNRGDWLMFEAMLEQVRARRPSAKVGVPDRVYAMSPGVYEHRGVVPVIVGSAKCDRLLKILTKMCAFLLRCDRPLFSEEIDIVLFSPGFRFSDQCDVPSKSFVEREYRYFQSFRKKGRKVYFMPQAFGPFGSELNKERVKKLLTLADHIYARENTSFASILPLAPARTVVSIVPDFTWLYKGEEYLLPFNKHEYVVVVPNRQMLVRTSDNVAESYCDFMIRLLRRLLSRGENVVLLNHEGAREGIDDITLIDVLNAFVGNAAYVVRNVSGGACKSVIARSKLVVTSRFHGLVSALAEGVPAFCTSWSHKYQELVAEMECPNSCLDLHSVDDALNRIEDALSSPDKYTSSDSARQRLEQKVVAMWDEILPNTHEDIRIEQQSLIRSKSLFYIPPHYWDSAMRILRGTCKYVLRWK